MLLRERLVIKYNKITTKRKFAFEKNEIHSEDKYI